MQRYPMTDVIATREYRLTTPGKDTPVTVTVGSPAPAPDQPGAWYCPWVVTRDGESQMRTAIGTDSLQALVLGLATLRALLEYIAQTGKLTCLGGIEGPFIEFP